MVKVGVCPRQLCSSDAVMAGARLMLLEFEETVEGTSYLEPVFFTIICVKPFLRMRIGGAFLYHARNAPNRKGNADGFQNAM